MRIEINENRTLLVALTDEGLDNDNFVELDFGEDGEDVVCVPLDDLLCAVHAFEEKRRINKEKNYERQTQSLYRGKNKC